MFLKTSMWKEHSIFIISAPGLLTHFIELLSFCADFRIHEIIIFLVHQPWVKKLSSYGTGSIVISVVNCVKCVPLPVTCIKQDKPPPPPLCSAHSPPPHPNTSLSAEIHRFNPAEIIQNCLRFIRIIIWQKEVGITIMIAKKFLLESCEHSVIVLLSCDETLLQSVFIFQLPSWPTTKTVIGIIQEP